MIRKTDSKDVPVVSEWKVSKRPKTSFRLFHSMPRCRSRSVESVSWNGKSRCGSGENFWSATTDSCFCHVCCATKWRCSSTTSDEQRDEKRVKAVRHWSVTPASPFGFLPFDWSSQKVCGKWKSDFLFQAWKFVTCFQFLWITLLVIDIRGSIGRWKNWLWKGSLTSANESNVWLRKVVSHCYTGICCIHKSQSCNFPLHTPSYRC